jgi:hypothetical protein
MTKHLFILFLLIFILSSCQEDGGIFSSEEKKIDELVFTPNWKSYSLFVWAFEHNDSRLEQFDSYSSEYYDGETGEILNYEYKVITLYNGKLFMKAEKGKVDKNQLPTTIKIKRLF